MNANPIDGRPCGRHGGDDLDIYVSEVDAIRVKVRRLQRVHSENVQALHRLAAALRNLAGAESLRR